MDLDRFPSVVLLFLLIAAPLVSGRHYYDYPEGDYCGGAVSRCCDGRIDSCAVPFLGTLCYCDQFCNRTDSSDCCPDYWSACLGIQPPEPLIQERGCFHDGRSYPFGHSVRINCNKWFFFSFFVLLRQIFDDGGFLSSECRRSVSDPSRTEFDCEADACIVDHDAIRRINSQKNLGWTAGNHSEFWGRKLEDGIVLRLGTLEPERFVSAKATQSVTPINLVTALLQRCWECIRSNRNTTPKRCPPLLTAASNGNGKRLATSGIKDGEVFFLR